MHLPFFTNPDKHNRFPLQWTLAGLLVLGWGSMAELEARHSEPYGCGYAQSDLVPDPEPVQWITVTTSKWVRECVTSQTSGIVSYHCGRRLRKTTYQMPLMELYTELCAVEDKAERLILFDGSSMTKASDEVREHFYLRFEKEFMRKYGLTLEKVKMIKRDGYRTKHGIER